MKNKTKENLLIVLENLLIVFLLFLIIYFTLALLSPYINPKPEYNMTKEVCENESVYQYTNNFYNETCRQTILYDKDPLEVEAGYVIVKEILNSTCKICWFTDIYGSHICLIPEKRESIYKTIQKCSQVEVDEIEVINFLGVGFMFDYDLSSIQDINIDNSYCEIKDNKTYCFPYKIQNISKSDLTQDWLEENCECINYGNRFDCSILKEGENIKVIGGGDCSCHKFRGNISLACSTEGWKNIKCQKYKCGEVWVEVLR